MSYRQKWPHLNSLLFDLNEFSSEKGNIYELLSEEHLGSGGNAEVYLCEDEFGEKYAVKFLKRLNNAGKTRFQREINLLSSLSHMHLLAYHDYGTLNVIYKNKNYEVPFIITQLANNGCLRKQISLKSPIPFEIYAPQFKGLSQALVEMHTKAIHRDIKPDNILISDDRWILSDFGLCRFLSENSSNCQDITRFDEKIGPAFWMSPEAMNKLYGLANSEITEVSDIFQLASVFWMIVNLSHPSGVVSRSIWKGPPKLFDVLYYSLHQDLNARPQNAQVFSEMIIESIEG